MTGIRVFELVEVLEAGKSAKARLLNWNGERYQPSAFVQVQVHDYVGESGVPGDCGYCFLSNESHRWEVLCGLPAPQAEAVAAPTSSARPPRRLRRSAKAIPSLDRPAAQDWTFSNFM
ncbi:MAG TPA: hypothetical protein VGG64_06020 [Pirellulales bacterium]|jgi:hypothetical protein